MAKGSTAEVKETPQTQLVSEQEMSQIKKRQLALKQEPQVQSLAEKIDVKIKLPS